MKIPWLTTITRTRTPRLGSERKKILITTTAILPIENAQYDEDSKFMLERRSKGFKRRFSVTTEEKVFNTGNR
jgi:hypothetical protein